MMDLTGKRFGRLLVLHRTDKPETYKGSRRHSAYWLVKCSCGTETVAGQNSLIAGDKTSCGCVKREMNAQRSASKKTRPPEYFVWKAARHRCLSPTDKAYANYGGRGIYMCSAWTNSFEVFLNDMGPRPSALHTLERKNNDSGYCPENCVWTTRAEQNRNSRKNHILEFNGKKQILSEWSRELGIPINVISARINLLGWSESEALSTPVRRYVRAKGNSDE